MQKKAFPEFYIGLIVSIVMVITYFVIDQKAGEFSVVKTAE